jgi:hypothetical protein
MAKVPFLRKPKYETDYSDDLSRKVFYKVNFLVEEFKLLPESEIKGAGHLLNDSVNDTPLDTAIRIILDDSVLRTRFIVLMHKHIDNPGIVCCMIRKMSTQKITSWDDLKTYTQEICKQYTGSQCLKMNERLIRDIEHLVPAEFNPTHILDLYGTKDSKHALEEKFSDVQVDTEIKDTNYDLVILSHCLHHLDTASRKKTIGNITDAMVSGGYLFVREQDVASEEDTILSNFAHSYYNHIGHGASGNASISYIPRDELAGLFQSLKFVSESPVKNDPYTNPLKNYYMLFYRH